MAKYIEIIGGRQGVKCILYNSTVEKLTNNRQIERHGIKASNFSAPSIHFLRDVFTTVVVVFA